MTKFTVNDMSCEHCVQRVTKAIEGVAGVQSAVVNLESKSATINWAPGNSPNVDAVVQAVKNAGYQAAVATQ